MTDPSYHKRVLSFTIYYWSDDKTEKEINKVIIPSIKNLIKKKIISKYENLPLGLDINGRATYSFKKHEG